MTVTAFPKTRLTLGFLCPHNPYDRRAFSGSSYFASKALASHPGIDLRILGNHRPPRFLDRLKRTPSSKLDATDDIVLDGLDGVVGLVATPLLNKVLEQAPTMPVIHVTDATPAFLSEAYGWALPESAYVEERKLAANASTVVYSSPQMAARARHDLNLAQMQTAVAPFGVNFDDLPKTCPQKTVPGRLNLLFVGLDWVRKGGDVAVETLNRLRSQGIDAHLTIVGRCPERHRTHAAITYIGLLSKNRPRDVATLSRLYRDAHVLLLPSRSDCTPMVVAEAMAHGTPVIATDTGGVASLLGGGGTGRLLQPHASPSEWAAMVRSMTDDPAAYQFMSDACYDRGQVQISWATWADQIVTCARQSLHPEYMATG